MTDRSINGGASIVGGGLAALMLGERTDAGDLLRRAADEYRASWAAAPAASRGRPIAAMRCRLRK